MRLVRRYKGMSELTRRRPEVSPSSSVRDVRKKDKWKGPRRVGSLGSPRTSELSRRREVSSTGYSGSEMLRARTPYERQCRAERPR